MEKLKFRKEEAIKILCCDEKTSNTRIKDKLKKLLMCEKVIVLGRGKDTRFIATVEIEDLTNTDVNDNEYYYNTLRNHFIENNIIKANTNFDKLLELINIYIQNESKKEVLLLEDLSSRLNISKQTISKYNKLLEKIDVIKIEEECEKVVIIKDNITQEYQELDYGYYDDFIISRMNYFVNKTRDFYNYEKNKFEKVYIYTDFKGWLEVYGHKCNSITFITSTTLEKPELTKIDDIEIDDMGLTDNDIERIKIRNQKVFTEAELYATENNLQFKNIENTVKPLRGSDRNSTNVKVENKIKQVELPFFCDSYMTQSLYGTIFDILCTIHGIDELKVYRIRTISKKLREDNEMLKALKCAITYVEVNKLGIEKVI